MAIALEAIAPPIATLPPLMNGDRLTRHEFERRYGHMPGMKAELIDGRVFVASPVRFEGHGEEHLAIITWLGVYTAFTPGVRGGDNSTVRLDDDSEPQPDVLLLLPSGTAHIGPDGYVEGPPELVIEIAASSAAYDLYDKRDVYQRNGVREYAVWQIYERRFDWWILEDAVYQPLSVKDGIIRSRTFPGLWLNVPALLGGKLAAVLATGQQGIASDEHTVFVAEIKDKVTR